MGTDLEMCGSLLVNRYLFVFLPIRASNPLSKACLFGAWHVLRVLCPSRPVQM